MSKNTAIVTNHDLYGGPPAAAALAELGFATLCHGQSLATAENRAAFQREHPRLDAAAAQTPEDLVEEALTRYGHIDVVISNDVGVVRPDELGGDTAADFRVLLESLAITPLRLIVAALPHMKARGRGRIVLVTSAAPLRPLPRMSAYSAARAAANNLVKSLALELGPFGLSVNAIAPMYLESSYFPHGMDDPAIATRVQEIIPMQRMGRPDEFAELIRPLVVPGAAFVSGQIIAFSGGSI